VLPGSASLLSLVAGRGHSHNAQSAPNNLAAETELCARRTSVIVRAGFGRLSEQLTEGIPFRISLSNQGPPSPTTDRSRSSPNPNPQVREYVKHIQLPTGSRQLHEIAAFLNSGESPIVRLQSEDRVVAETRVTVERSYMLSDQLMIAVLDTDSTALNNISSAEVIRVPNRAPFKSAAPVGGQLPQPDPQLAIPLPPSSTQGPRRGRVGGPNFGRPVPMAHPTVISAEDLPREFISFDQLDVVVIGDAPLNQLAEEQARALRLWVGSGGLLVVTGAADIAGIRAIGLDSILPVEAQATTTVDSLPELKRTARLIRRSTRRVTARLKPRLTLDWRGFTIRSSPEELWKGLVRFVAINPKLSPYRAWTAARILTTCFAICRGEETHQWITSGRRGNSTSNRWGVQGFCFIWQKSAIPEVCVVLSAGVRITLGQSIPRAAMET
jgi:hypothetical protein